MRRLISLTLVASAFFWKTSSIFTARFLTSFIPSISSTLTVFTNSLCFWKRTHKTWLQWMWMSRWLQVKVERVQYSWVINQSTSTYWETNTKKETFSFCMCVFMCCIIKSTMATLPALQKGDGLHAGLKWILIRRIMTPRMIDNLLLICHWWHLVPPSLW